jgi:hypothetical protein
LVSDKNLSILGVLRKNGGINRLGLYAIVPYAFEYARLAGGLGGVPGLPKKLLENCVFGEPSCSGVGFKWRFKGLC